MGTADNGRSTIRLTLDVVLGTSPISGVVHGDSDADDQEFVGWTALASVIGAALTTNGDASDERGDGHERVSEITS